MFFALASTGACARAVTEEPNAAAKDAGGFDAAPDAHEDAASCPNGCPTGEVCSGGTCKSQCDTPLTQCGAVCTDLAKDTEHCGQCGTSCTTGDAGGMTPGPDWSLGAAACKSGSCAIDCPTAMTLCSDRVCYDTKTNHDNCGACGTACAAGETCCGGGCADLSSDPNNCGACGNACDGGGCSSGTCAACVPATITGPTLSQNIGGWPNAGIRITALKNTTLTSFVVQNQGNTDTVELTDTSGTVLQTLTLPASSTSYTANVSWSLVQGTSYDLILVGSDNGKWDSYTTWPETGNGLEIVATVDQSQTLQSSYWFTFTNLTSCP